MSSSGVNQVLLHAVSPGISELPHAGYFGVLSRSASEIGTRWRSGLDSNSRFRLFGAKASSRFPLSATVGSPAPRTLAPAFGDATCRLAYGSGVTTRNSATFLLLVIAWKTLPGHDSFNHRWVTSSSSFP